MAEHASAERNKHKGLRRLLRRIITRFLKPIRALYRYANRKKLTNHDFTIIGNNCCAGVIYHDLGERFNSPTINLWIPNEYFFEFLNHLDFYVHAEPEQIYIEGLKYPIGRIRREDKEIQIHFMHYDTFSAASQKWLERGQRIRKDNLFVIFNTTDNNWIQSFSKLPYKQKVMLTYISENMPAQDNIVSMPVYAQSDVPGVILTYKALFSLQRWLDDFDYISFLNRS